MGKTKAVPLWTDGIHYVRGATTKDRHPMRFVVDAHKLAGLSPARSLPRHAPTLEAGIEIAKHHTGVALAAASGLTKYMQPAEGDGPVQQDAASPAVDEPVLQEPPRPAKLNTAAPRVRKPREKKEKPRPAQKFATTRFVCIAANSVTQVWQCVKDRSEAAPVGRRKAGGSAAEGDKLSHNRGDCAVLMGDVPVLDEHRRVRVFHSWQEAEEEAERIFYATPEDERFPLGSTKVYANLTAMVCFDPACNTRHEPFNIYFHEGYPLKDERCDMPKTFRKITGAIAEADRIDRKLRGAP